LPVSLHTQALPNRDEETYDHHETAFRRVLEPGTRVVLVLAGKRLAHEQ
jgi:hypothetical protein